LCHEINPLSVVSISNQTSSKHSAVALAACLKSSLPMSLASLLKYAQNYFLSSLPKLFLSIDSKASFIFLLSSFFSAESLSLACLSDLSIKS